MSQSIESLKFEGEIPDEGDDSDTWLVALISKVKLDEGVLVLISFLLQTSPEGLRVDREVHGEGLFQALVARSAFSVKAFASASLNVVCADVDEGDLELLALCLACLV